MDSFEWSPGPNLPFPLEKAASVPFGNTFLLVGGNSDRNELQTILELDIVKMKWLVRSEELVEAREGAFAALTTMGYLGCN